MDTGGVQAYQQSNALLVGCIFWLAAKMGLPYIAPQPLFLSLWVPWLNLLGPNPKPSTIPLLFPTPCPCFSGG